MGTKAVAKPLRAAQGGSEPEKIGLAPEPEPFHQLSRWSRAVSGPSRAVTTLPMHSATLGEGYVTVYAGHGSESRRKRGRWRGGRRDGVRNKRKS